jgi:hypothetical protein
MALGKRKDAGNFLPGLKYDARVGKFYLRDRVFTDGSWKTEQHEITVKFEATFDLENIQRGWINFPKGAAPEVVLVPAGEDPGEAPSDQHKEGFRVLVKMPQELGGEVRELLSTARGLWNAIDALHDSYLAAAPDHPGELPKVELADVKETATAVEPVFRITGWVPRPPALASDLVTQRRASVSQISKINAALSPAELDDEVPF